MTNADAYTIGWVYGLIVQATGAEPDQNAAQKPYTSLGRLMVSHAAPGMVSEELSMQIGAALASIENMEIPAAGSEEAVQPPDIQSAWNLGYFAGFGGRPLDNGFDIEAARIAAINTPAINAGKSFLAQAINTVFCAPTVRSSSASSILPK